MVSPTLLTWPCSHLQHLPSCLLAARISNSDYWLLSPWVSAAAPLSSTSALSKKRSFQSQPSNTKKRTKERNFKTPVKLVAKPLQPGFVKGNSTFLVSCICSRALPSTALLLSSPSTCRSPSVSLEPQRDLPQPSWL